MTGRTLVGSIVGPLAERPTSGSLLSNSGDGTDFAIGGLGFKLAIGDNRPYRRATAEFRKNQFDAATTAGDQSLTGWWKRGQLSFHAGAGVTYYEVLDGEATANRFQSSADVDVSTPGQVTLGSGWSLASAVTDIIYGVPTSDGYAAYLTSGGEVYCSATGVTIYPPTSGTAVGVCAGPGDRVFVATTADKIEATDTTLVAGTVYYTHAEDIRHIWYAKNRLWMLDSTGALYQLSPTVSAPPVAVAAGDLVCTFTEAADIWSAPSWHMAESPAAVYFGHESGVVYAVTIDTDGSLPTLSAPLEVARLPHGETLLGLGYYLGHLVLQTDTGVRLAAVGADVIALGPKFLEVASTTTRTVAGAGERVFIAGDSDIYSIDLAQPITGVELTFGWVKEHEASTLRGVVNEGGTIIAYGDTGPLQQDGTATEGHLVTGLHRFGTLEPKQFHAVRVLVGGTGGSVTVSRVGTDGSATTLHTIDVAQASEVDVSVSLALPANSMGLRFDLAADGADTPTLYGYQLRALPAPTRQRLIQVPLLLFDVERARPSRSSGGTADAWRRLSALEDMERTGGTFIFQDFRTGETGTCFIESVEHDGVTPPGVTDRGFGGVVTLTLRKLD